MAPSDLLLISIGFLVAVGMILFLVLVTVLVAKCSEWCFKDEADALNELLRGESRISPLKIGAKKLLSPELRVQETV